MEKKEVYIVGMAAGGIIEALGMQAENMIRAKSGTTIRYSYDDFERLMLDRGLHHNSLIEGLYRD